MAKDPAFLFYPGDWQGGTSTFSRFFKGCYLDVLIAQFNSGHLSLDEIKTVLGSDFGQAWPALQKKFKKDSDGLLFNEKLDTEIIRRKEYSKSRSDNRKGKTHDKDMLNISNTYVQHMETEAVTEDRIKEAFDNLNLDKIKLKWSHIDFEFEYETFCDKVRGSPDHYIGHSASGLRLAFQSQLRGAKSKPKPKEIAPKPYEEAEYNKSLWTLEAWEKAYEWRLLGDNEFRKHFGYDEKLPSSGAMGSNGKR